MKKSKPIAVVRCTGRIILPSVICLAFAFLSQASLLGQMQNGGMPANNGMPATNGGARQFLPANSQPPNGNFGQPNLNPGQQGIRVAEKPVFATSGQPTNAQTSDASGAGEKQGKITVSLLQMFHDGGWMMYPIALCSFILTVFTFERLINLRTGRVIPRPFVKRLIEQLQQQQIDKEEALELCDRNPSPIASILTAAVKKYGRPAVEVEQAVLDAGERESNLLRRNMRLLNAISNVSPLLGLLGTVLGMIQAFNDISSAQAMGRPDLLAGGISQALLTTAAGLLVAIPAYLLYMFFLGRTDKLIMEMDSHAQRLVEVVSAEGLQENDTSRSRSRARKAA